MGIGIIKGSRGGEIVLIYIMALRLGLNNFRSFTTLLMGVSRFYPQVSRYWQFVNNAQSSTRDARQQGNAPLPESYKIGNNQKISIINGMKVVVFSPCEINRYTVGHFINMLFCRKNQLSKPYCVQPVLFHFPDVYHQENLGRTYWGFKKGYSVGGGRAFFKGT